MDSVVGKALKAMAVIVISTAIGCIFAFMDISGIFISGQAPLREAAFVLLLCILMFVTVSMNRDISKILFIGLAARISLALAISFYNVLPYSYDIQWDLIAQQLYQDWTSGHFHLNFEASDNVKYYTYLTSFVYLIFGYNPVFMQLLNAFFGTMTILVVYKLANKLFNPKAARVSAWIMALFPSHIMFSAMNMRDALSTLLMSAFIYQFVVWSDQAKKRKLFGVVILFVLNTLIRTQNAVLLLVASAPFIYKTIHKKTNPYLRPIVLMGTGIILLGIVGYLYSSGLLTNASFDYLSREMEYRSSGGSGYLEWMTYGSWIDIVKYAPIRAVYFMFSPFPWDVSTPAQAVAALENLVLWFMVLVMVRKWKKIKELTTNKTLLMRIVIIFIVGIIANAVVDANAGTALRHKLQYIYVIIILYAATKQTTPKAAP